MINNHNTCPIDHLFLYLLQRLCFKIMERKSWNHYQILFLDRQVSQLHLWCLWTGWRSEWDELEELGTSPSSQLWKGFCRRAWGACAQKAAGPSPHPYTACPVRAVMNAKHIIIRRGEKNLPWMDKDFLSFTGSKNLRYLLECLSYLFFEGVKKSLRWLHVASISHRQNTVP